MLGFLLFCSFLDAGLGLPSIYPLLPLPPTKLSSDFFSTEDMVVLSSRQIRFPKERSTKLPGFQYMYVPQEGKIVEGRRPSKGAYIEVVGSPRTPRQAMHVASDVLAKMMRHVPPALFNKMAKKPDLGLALFTMQEKITVYPEVAAVFSHPECEGKGCEGACSDLCSADGRRYDLMFGINIGFRAYAIVDNVMCSAADPYGQEYNLVVHEMAHVVERVILLKDLKRQLKRAYNNAVKKQLWEAGSYAMNNMHEYWAEVTGSFFLASVYFSNGGMTDCSPGKMCGTEMEVRQFLRDRDPQLWDLLNAVYTGGNPALTSGMTICPK